MLSKLRKQRRIEKFFINMTVMKSNYHEMERFTKMGLKLGCDSVFFHKIFGIQNLEENINIFPNSSVFREIKKILNKSAFKNKKVRAVTLSHQTLVYTKWPFLSRLFWINFMEKHKFFRLSNHKTLFSNTLEIAADSGLPVASHAKKSISHFIRSTYAR